MKYILGVLDEIAEYIQDDHDYCMAISGFKRTGKSTLAQQMAEHIQAKLKSNFWLCYQWEAADENQDTINDLKKQMGIREENLYPSSLKYALLNSSKYDIILVDEAVSFLQALKWNTPEVREFTTLFDQFGYKDLFIMLLMPSFRTFAKGFRVDRLNAHIWVQRRGYCHMFPTTKNKDGVFMSDKPTFKDTFPPLTKTKEKRYRVIKELSLQKQIQEKQENGKLNKWDILLKVNSNLKGQGFNQKERAEILGVQPSHLCEREKIPGSQFPPVHM